ncbi:MAG: hypothetical protein GXO87_06165, partial [Chlorobi bacterium]|nr:hypothetical protein [Chlorobiota bacterium]
FLSSCGSPEKKSGKRKKEKSANEITLMEQDKREDIKSAANHVKERKIVSYFYNKYGKVSERGFLVEKKIYNEKGELTEVTRFLSNGDIDLRWTYEYNDNGDIVHSKTVNGLNFLRYERKSKYDDDGKEIEREEYDVKTKKFNKIVYEYDDKGDLLVAKTYNSDGNLLFLENNEYDDKGRIVLKKRENPEGALFTVTQIEYDSLGRKSKELVKDFRAQPSFTIFSYDSLGYLKGKNRGFVNELFINDENGNIVTEKLFDGGGGLQQRIDYFYDEKGLLSERIRYDGMENPALFIKYEYEFYRN